MYNCSVDNEAQFCSLLQLSIPYLFVDIIQAFVYTFLSLFTIMFSLILFIKHILKEKYSLLKKLKDIDQKYTYLCKP